MQVSACTPPPEPVCRSRNYPLFKTPISAQRTPECSPPRCPTECTGGNPNVRINNLGTLDRSKWIEGWITTQLFTRGQIDCEDHPLGKRDGGWWADAFRTGLAFRSGSKLWALKWERVTNATLMKAKEYTVEALSYLLAWGVVSSLTVTPTYVSHNVLHITIKITGPGVSQQLVFEGTALPNSVWLWEEYRPGQAKRPLGSAFAGF